MIKLNWKSFTLRLRHVFRISRGARDNCPLVLTALSFGGYTGYGEASMPPLYGESEQSARSFLESVDLSGFETPLETSSILQYVDDLAPGNPAVKASLDIALHDLIGKMLGIPLYQYFGLPARRLPTAMTISLDEPEEMARKAEGYTDFSFLKIKLGTERDREIILAIRGVTGKPLFVDANQGWTEREAALDFICWLAEQGVVFVEQPLPKDKREDQAWLVARSPLPLIGDESVQRLSDIREASSLFHGINIKLMKSTGLREAFRMATTARALGMKLMLGCMSETSCAITAAAHLGALADWIDLDGHLDAANDPFRGVRLEEGHLVHTGLPGLGIEPLPENPLVNVA